MAAATADAAACSVIGTRNINDFRNSPVTALALHEYLTKIDA